MEISNFTKMQAVEVVAEHHLSAVNLVRIWQHSGSMNFQFDMTPDQARELAKALIEAADSLSAG